MPIMGKCPYCHKSAGLFRVQHDRCEAAHRDGLRQDGQRQMVTLVAETVAAAAVAASESAVAEAARVEAALSASEAALAPRGIRAYRIGPRPRGGFMSEDAWLNLSNELSNIAASSYIDVGDVPGLVLEGWNRAVRTVIENSRLSPPEKDGQLALLGEFPWTLSSRGLHGLVPPSSFGHGESGDEFRNKFYQDTQKRLNRYASSRLADTAKRLLLLPDLSSDLLGFSLVGPRLFRELDAGSRQDLLTKAWSEAVLAFPKDCTLSLEQEQALWTYLFYFGLTPESVNQNSALKVMVQFKVLREIAEGEIPDRSGAIGSVPFNMVKSERLIWETRNVDYCEPVTRQEWRGTASERGFFDSTFLSAEPSFSQSTTTSHSRLIEWEETVKVDTGSLFVTSEHLYFHGSRQRLRIPYGRIVALEHLGYGSPGKVRGSSGLMVPLPKPSLGIALTQDHQGAKLQKFRTSDGWFIYRLASTLAQR